jgi:hypothetical protein
MIQGIFMSNQGIVGDRVGDFSSAILQIAPTGTALMLALSSGMGKSSAQDTIFTWFEDAHQAGRTGVVSATSGGLGTSVVVEDGTMYVPGQVLLVEETGEVIYVTQTSGATLTVIRGIGGSSVVAITNAHHVQNIGNAHEEASNRPVAVTQQGVARSNLTQIFRNAWAVSGTTKAVKYRTGGKLAKNKADCALYHAEEIEKSFIWGRKHLSSLNGKPFRMSDGIVSQLQQYGGIVEAAESGNNAGDLSWIDFEDFIRRVFSTNVKGQPNERIAIGGDIVVAVLNQMARLDGTYNIAVNEEVLGIKITRLVTAFGSIKLMTHPLFNENPTWQKDLMVLHPGAIRKRVLRETEDEGYDANGRRFDGQDADEGIMTTELGFEVGAASTMGMLTNVTKAVASSGT